MKKILLGLALTLAFTFAQGQKVNLPYKSDTVIAHLTGRQADTLALKHTVTFFERDAFNVRCDVENFNVFLGDLLDSTETIRSYEATLGEYFIVATFIYKDLRLMQIRLSDETGSLTYILNRKIDDVADYVGTE